MKLLDLTLSSPAENLALDEALLEEAEASGEPAEVLRLWEAADPFVVLGRSSKLAVEVQQDVCERLGVPILRRCSGGGAVLAGPGCLMYAVVLSCERDLSLRMIERAHQFVLGKLAAALRQERPGVKHQGISDLTLGEHKFSGNSLRCKRTHLLYHGTILHRFPLQLIGRCLGRAPREPDYRAGRTHGDFLRNLDLPVEALREALVGAWDIEGPLREWPSLRTAALVRTRYGLDQWNRRL